MNRTLPRILFAAPKSGAGKTTVVCGFLQLLKNRGMSPAACKCGPDYIDPLFHREVIGAKSANLDLFFTDEATTRCLLQRASADCDVAVLEGVMGYYDGLGGTTEEASAYHLAKATQTPAVLVVDAKGSSLSLCAQIKGFLAFRPQSGIRAVVLNRCSAMLYATLKPLVESECGIPVLGHLPHLPECALESRHLGLVTAQEVTNLQEKLQILAASMEKFLDVDGLLALAGSAAPLETADIPILPVTDGAPVIAVAKDQAFCFYYNENLALLEQLGAKLAFFSPLADKVLPPCHGLYLGGGYPELHTAALSGNETMRQSVSAAVKSGLPTFAECGGFLYLLESLEGAPMAGILPGGSHNTQRLSRFGYVELTALQDNLLCTAGETIRAHEFHYYDADNCGTAFTATKPLSGRQWSCIHASSTLFAGFPHLYFHANPAFATRFVAAAARYQEANL